MSIKYMIFLIFDKLFAPFTDILRKLVSGFYTVIMSPNVSFSCNLLSFPYAAPGLLANGLQSVTASFLFCRGLTRHGFCDRF